MRKNITIGLMIFLIFGAVGCSTMVVNKKVIKRKLPPVTVAQAVCDFDKDGRKDVLSLIWVDGKNILFEDDEKGENFWCGQGDKYEGKFIFRVHFWKGATVDTPLESIFPEGPPFVFIFEGDGDPCEIRMADYNHDRQIDFNIPSYGGCEWSRATLFTVLPTGKVEPLTVDYDLSLDDLESAHMTPNGFWFVDYNRREEKAYQVFLDWDKSKKTFHSLKRKITHKEWLELEGQGPEDSSQSPDK